MQSKVGLEAGLCMGGLGLAERRYFLLCLQVAVNSVLEFRFVDLSAFMM